MKKYTWVLGLVGGVTGIVIACEKQSGFIGGVGYWVVGSIAGSIVGVIIDQI